MGLGGPGPPRPQGVVWTRAGTGQGGAAQMGTPVCPQQPGAWQKLLKHKIKVTDQMTLKECYQCIPPHMNDEVRAHIQEMLDIGAIWKLHSPWASTVVLVWKKDGSLRFCIDLRKLNNQTINDAYLLSQIAEILDSLQGSQWFSSLDLKSGYWQVEMDEESKPLTAFTVGPLGFSECKRIPFGLTNAPTTFQRLGNLNLHWCIIYLGDIVIFSKDMASHLERLRLCSANWRRLDSNSSLLSVSYSDGRLPTWGMWSLPKE